MIKSEISTELCRFLTEMNKSLEVANEQAIHRRYVTSVVIRITMVIMVALSIANGFFLDMLSTGLSDSLESAEIMSSEFSAIEKDMRMITVSVASIDQQMGVLTVLDKDMSKVNKNMGAITHEMHSIAKVVTGIEHSVHQVDNSMNYVDGRIQDVSNDMLYLGDDVHRMTKPVKWMNKMMPW